MGKINKNSLTPKLFSIIRDGYSFNDFRSDAFAGLTVAVIALPLAMALGIASGASPEQGLITAVVAGFLISFFGGSRIQIGGPTGAFVVVVLNAIAQHGYEGLIIATVLAGLILILAGMMGMGQVIKYIPQPVVIGFTTGIAVIIATTQVKYFFGLQIDIIPTEFIYQWQKYFSVFNTFNAATFITSFITLIAIVLLKKIVPRWPRYLVVMLCISPIIYFFDIPIETVGSKFPDITSGITIPTFPIFTIDKIKEILPTAFTIAFLAGIESLLSAVVADGMTGFKHRSNIELIGQGIANIGSAIFGGLPATGAIARTATNATSGGKTPVAGIIHALFVLLFMLFGMDVIKFIPMSVLAAILYSVAWGMSEFHQFVRICKVTGSDKVILILTFLLTIFVDLTVAIGVGVTLASLIFMARMSKAVEISNAPKQFNSDSNEHDQRLELPSDVEAYWIAGPVFFGMTNDLLEILKQIGHKPKVLIIRMRLVPYLDSTGALVLSDLIKHCQLNNTKVILSSVQNQPFKVLSDFHKGKDCLKFEFSPTFNDAVFRAKKLINL